MIRLIKNSFGTHFHLLKASVTSQHKYCTHKKTENGSRNALWKARADLDKFHNIFPRLVEDLLKNKKYFSSHIAAERFKEMMYYNISESRLSGPLVMLSVYNSFKPQSKYMEEPEDLVYTMAWLIEMFITHTVVIDDIQDKSEIRRKKMCWYLTQRNQSIAISDAIIMCHMVFVALKTYFQHKPYYIPCLETFLEMNGLLQIGQMLDCYVQNATALFKMETYRRLATDKSLYTLYLPFVIGIYVAGIHDEQEVLDSTREIIADITYMFQLENDFNDCYPDRKTFNHNGDDIQVGKCTWLITAAMEDASEEQKKLLEQCYGSKKEENVATIERIYQELNMVEKYNKYANDKYSNIRQRINLVQNNAAKEILTHFTDTLEKGIYYL